MSIPVSELRRVERATVYKGLDAAGVLVRTQKGVQFHYDPRYLQAGLPPVASSLPLELSGAETFGGALPTFFSNLLPEGLRLFALRDRAKTSLSDELTLLLAVGRDCVGDVSIVPEGEDLEGYPEMPTLDELDLEELVRIATAAFDLHAIAGVQEKVSSDLLTVPTFTRMGPAIVKLAPPNLPHLVRNEHFFMEMAAGCGLKTAKTKVLKDAGGREALWIKRFDRQREAGQWVRLAQEDGCQLTDIYPADKYRISLQEIAKTFVRWSAAPAVALQALLELVAFSYLIGNGDLHAKNISLGATRLGMMPTPAYDLLSTLPYRHLDQRMALRIDGRDDNLRRKHLHGFFGRFGLPEKAIDQSLDRILAKAGPWIDRISEIGFMPEETERTMREIRERASSL